MTPAVSIEPFAPADRDACLRVFDSNAPRFFAPAEQATFAAFLDSLPGPYWVVRISPGEGIVGCGGVSVEPPGRIAWLRWGMVDGDSHRLGIGRQLLAARLGWIRAHPDVETVRVATSAAASGFFQRLSFTLVRMTVDAYGPKLDRPDRALAIGSDTPRGGAIMSNGNPHIGSSFDDFLKEEGIEDEVRAEAISRAAAWSESNKPRQPIPPEPKGVLPADSLRRPQSLPGTSES